MPRRQLIAGLSGLVPTAVGGCFDDASTAAPAAPTTAVQRYFEAPADGDRDRANQFAHPDGDYYIDDDAGPFLGVQNLSITETDPVDTDTAIRSMFTHTDMHTDEETDQEHTAIEAVKDTHGVTDSEYVRHEPMSNGLTFNPIYLLFEDSGWGIWPVPTFHRNR